MKWITLLASLMLTACATAPLTAEPTAPPVLQVQEQARPPTPIIMADGTVYEAILQPNGEETEGQFPYVCFADNTDDPVLDCLIFYMGPEGMEWYPLQVPINVTVI